MNWVELNYTRLRWNWRKKKKEKKKRNISYSSRIEIHMNSYFLWLLNFSFPVVDIYVKHANLWNFTIQSNLNVISINFFIFRLIEESLKVAQNIAQKSPVAVQTAKKSLIYSRDHSVEEGLEHIVSSKDTLLVKVINFFSSSNSKNSLF